MASVLPNSIGLTMRDPQFNVVANQTNIQQSSASENDPMRILLGHSALSAMADSPTVYEPTCHPGTRTLVSDHIMVWARDPKATPILWLSGPAGAGKSCIQRTIVQSTTAEGLFVGCFFFSIKQSETNNQSRFVATLAAQLAENIPGLKWYIERAIKTDGRVFEKALEMQGEGLIWKPLQEWDGSMSNRLTRVFWRTLMALVAYEEDPDTPWTRANVIVVDGLDECVDQTEQARILGFIHSLATHPHFPFRFAIASRPEYTIRTAFSSPPLSNKSIILRLEEYEADGDLRRFLKAEFSGLKSNHPASAFLPAGWPSAEDENVLVTKASKQFVYVSVVMKHLKNPRRNPMLELRQIVDYRPSANVLKSNPFAELDALYDRILHPPEIDSSLLKRILHSIIHDKPRGSVYPEDDLDLLFGLTPGTTASTLVDLHSVLNFDSPTKRPILHHKSMEDFLISESRAGDLYQSDDQTHVQLALAYYELARQRRLQLNGAAISDHVRDLSLLTASHASFVSDWSLFDREFAKNALPAFINRVVPTQRMTKKLPNASNPVTDHPRKKQSHERAHEQGLKANRYWFQYHSFFCTSGGCCLPRCQDIGGELVFASSKAGCTCAKENSDIDDKPPSPVNSLGRDHQFLPIYSNSDSVYNPPSPVNSLGWDHQFLPIYSNSDTGYKPIQEYSESSHPFPEAGERARPVVSVDEPKAKQALARANGEARLSKIHEQQEALDRELKLLLELLPVHAIERQTLSASGQALNSDT